MEWAETLSTLAGKYLDYRRVESQDALAAQDAMFKADAERAKLAADQQAGMAPGWVMPAVLIGGGLLVVLLLVRK